MKEEAWHTRNMVETFEGIPKSSRRRKTMHVIDDNHVAPSTSAVEEPILYQTPNVPLSNTTFQQLLASIMKENK